MVIVQKPVQAVLLVRDVTAVVHHRVADVRVVHHAVVVVRQVVADVRVVHPAHQAVNHVRAVVQELAKARVIVNVQDARPLVQAHVMTLAQRQTKHRLSRISAVISASEML